MFNSRLGCSSISFRHQDLPAALRTISGLGFEEIDLGALPGYATTCPTNLDAAAVAAVTADVAASGLPVRSVNGDIGDLNAVLDADQQAAPRTAPGRAAHPHRQHRREGAGPPVRGAQPRTGPEPRRGPGRHRRPAHPRRHSARRSSASSSGPNPCTSSGSAGTWNARNCWRSGWRVPASGLSWTSATLSPPAKIRWSTSNAIRAASPTSTSAMPCRATSTSASATARPISPPASGPRSARLHRPLLPRTRNPGRHPRRTPRRRSESGQLHHRPHLNHRLLRNGPSDLKTALVSNRSKNNINQGAS